MPRFTDDAIVLRQTDWSETSQLVTLLTAERGKVRGLAKGSKRMSPSSLARFSGGFELCGRGQVLATTRRTTSLAAVTEWDLRAAYPQLRQDRRAWELAMVSVDFADAVLAEEDPNDQAFAILARFLDDVGLPPGGGASASSGEAALLVYQWDLLRAAGYRPELDADAVTGEALPAASAYAFDARAGGLVRQASSTSWNVRAQTIALLRRVDRGTWDRPSEDQAGPAVVRANRLLCVYLRAVLDRELSTMRYILGPE